MPDFPITDSHVHFWDPAHLRYTWLDGAPTLNRPFLPDDYRAACGPVAVGKIVFVECDGAGDQALAETDWVSALAQAEEPRIAGIVAYAPLEQGGAVSELLGSLAERPLVRGIRRLLQGEPTPGFCLQPDFITGVALLPRFGFSCDLCIRHHQLADVTELVRRCPYVSFILDHIAKPDIRAGLLDPWREQIADLARLPNVVCKLSGLATEADQAAWTDADLRPYIEHVLACFGADRVLYGSDWPVATLATPYPRWVETLDQALASYSEDVRRAIFAENANRVYRL